jgi:chromosome segregation ATPase
MTPPRPDITSHTDVDSVASSMSAEDVESMQKFLSETTSSLENAKKIIASLENANGSMAVDLRAKLKAKEDEYAAVQKESAERKRRLDSLATELRDLQKKQDDVSKLDLQSRTQVVRHKALMGLLEKSVSELQAASAVHEVMTATGQPDQANVEQISDVLNDAMIGIRTSLELSEQYIDEFDDDATAFTDADVSSEVGRQIDTIIKNDREALAKNLQNELEQKKIAVRRLEEALKKQNEEIRRLRVEQRSTGDNQQLLSEIKSLREQCSTNMEVLAKKELELSVLRSSLKVDDDDAGYISDDASDGEDENDTTMSSSSPRLNAFGPEQTEALATLLAAGGSMPDQEPELKKELRKAIGEKERSAKELQAGRESLANAKLIISSLEKANKSMMEDLRSRLQDSNTAISSLLDKSLEHEKNSNTLLEEVEKLKKEKETLESKLQMSTPNFLKAEKARDKSVTGLSEEKKDSL